MTSGCFLAGGLKDLNNSCVLRQKEGGQVDPWLKRPNQTKLRHGHDCFRYPRINRMLCKYRDLFHWARKPQVRCVGVVTTCSKGFAATS